MDGLWGEVQQLVVKTLIAVQPHLAHSYSSCRPSSEAHPFSCFELLGLDLLIDQDGQPSLLEVNHSPSLATDTPLDRELKTTLLADTMRLTAFSAAEEKLLKRAAERRETAPSAIPTIPRGRAAAAGRYPAGAARRGGSVGRFSSLRARLDSARELSDGASEAPLGWSLGRGMEPVLGGPGFKQSLVQQGLLERKLQAESQQVELRRLRAEYEAEAHTMHALP